MRRAPAALLAVVLLALGGHVVVAAPVPLPDFEVADRLVPRDPQPEREVIWPPGGNVVVTDVTYATYPGFRPLRLDLYRVANDRTPRPLIVYVHGGGWSVGNPRAGGSFLDLPVIHANLAQRGYVVASIQYRLSGEAPFPAQLQDVREALRFLRANSARLGIDATQIALWGMSAGAQLGALEAVSCGTASPEPAREATARPPCVQGFVGWFGAYDLNAYVAEAKKETAVGPLFRCGSEPCAAAVLAQASPINFVDGKDPPALLIHGTADINSLPAQSSRFAERLRAAGVPVELLLIPEVSHGFVGATPAATRDAARQALTATFDFFDRLFAAKNTSAH
jgi:acetyl esterase/lipase